MGRTITGSRNIVADEISGNIAKCRIGLGKNRSTTGITTVTGSRSIIADEITGYIAKCRTIGINRSTIGTVGRRRSIIADEITVDVVKGGIISKNRSAIGITTRSRIIIADKIRRHINITVILTDINSSSVRATAYIFKYFGINVVRSQIAAETSTGFGIGCRHGVSVI